MTDSKDIVKKEGEVIVSGAELTEFLFSGNLATLKEEQKAKYLFALCQSLGINPWTKPFDILVLGGKTVLYANKSAASQLKDVRGISTETVYAGPLRMGFDAEGRPLFDNAVYVVEVIAKDKKGRTSSNVGAVSIKNMAGEPLANAIMKAHTKANRRVILDHAGLGFSDESELESMHDRKDPGPKTIEVK